MHESAASYLMYRPKVVVPFHPSAHSSIAYGLSPKAWRPLLALTDPQWSIHSNFTDLNLGRIVPSISPFVNRVWVEPKSLATFTRSNRPQWSIHSNFTDLNLGRTVPPISPFVNRVWAEPKSLATFTRSNRPQWSIHPNSTDLNLGRPVPPPSAHLLTASVLSPFSRGRW